MNRFRTTQLGYRYDKVIFISVMLAFLGIVFYAMLANNFDFSTHPYFKCSYSTCPNPFYRDTILQEGQLEQCRQELKILWFIPLYTTKDCRENCDWCHAKLLSKGEYGSKPKAGFIVNNALWIGLGMILLGLILNHMLHNKGKQFDIEIPITNKIILNRNTIKEWKEKNEDNKDNS